MSLYDKMSRQPDGTLYMPGVVPNVRRPGDSTQEDDMREFDFDEQEVVQTVAKMTGAAVEEAMRLIRGEPGALRKEAIRRVLKGEDEYSLPQGVRDELQNWADVLGLTLSTLAELIRNIQRGVLQATNPELAPPPQTRAQQMIDAEIAASPHSRCINPLYADPAITRRSFSSL